MISKLSNSFKVLTLYNTSAKYKLATAFTSPLRNIHLQQPMLKSVEEKLGIPEKPKRPMSAYFRFMNEVRSSVQGKNPKLKAVEISSVIGKMWRALEASKKEKFSKAYKDEMVTYTETVAKYIKGLSEDDVLRLKETKAELKAELKGRKITLMQQKKARALGKPKKPLNSFMSYFRKQTDRQANEEQKRYIQRVVTRWQALPQSEQDKFKPSPKEVENYKKALAQWETKMRKLGHYDIVSGDSNENVENVTPRAPSKPRNRKSSSE